MSNNTTRAVLLVAAIALVGLFAGTAMAATAPSVTSTSDISNGGTVQITNASSSNVSTLNVTTPTGENADVEVEITLDDRDMTVYEADSSSGDYTLVAENNANSNDIHEWNISHDEFADVPVMANESVTLNYTVTSTADDGTTANTTGTFTLDNSWDRSVYLIDQPALDGNVDGLSVSEEMDDGWGIPYISEETTDYDAEADGTPIDGANTTVHVYVADSNASDEFSSAADSGVLSGSSLGAIRGYTSNMVPFDFAANGIAPDLSASSGDRIFEMTAIADSGEDGDDQAFPVFYESADFDIVDNETDTYAIYNPDDSSIEVHPGTDAYGNASTMDVRTGTMEPEDVLSRSAFASTMTADLGFFGELEAFGAADAAGLGGISLMIGVPVIGRIKSENGAAA